MYKIVGIFSLVFAFYSCSSDSGSSDSGSSGSTLKGTITYSGTGVNKFSVLAADTPSGYPYKAITHVDNPTFPATFELTEIPDGSFFIVGFLDKGAKNTGPPDADDISMQYGTGTITFVEGTEVPDIEIAMVDP